MKRPEDEILLRDMVDYARRAIAAVAGKERSTTSTRYGTWLSFRASSAMA